ncbi:MAG: spermidine/putrescine ABC transporter substrate-binding protein [Betaproteobacteria bacterium]|nr:spermidine/putrescine ABC transporter substrate-binding protein [Betaproteobacteria bacterium]
MARRLVMAAGMLAFFVAGLVRANGVLHLYNWNNYIAPQTLARFESVCRCRVAYDTYGSNEELLARLAAGATGYDILVPTGEAVQSLIRAGRLLPLDKRKLPNFVNIDPAYLNGFYDPGNVYSVPYAYTVTLLGYNVGKMRALGIPTDTWAALFDPRYLKRLRGRVTVLDDPRELLAAALKYLGYAANDVDPSHWQRAAQVIVKAKPYWAAFNNTSYIRLIASGDVWLAQGYSNDFFQAEREAESVREPFTIAFSVPKEGAVLAVDNMVVPKGAPRADLAYQFIDFMLEGRNASELTNLIGSGNPNRAARPFIRRALADNPAIFPDHAVLGRLEELRELDRKQRRFLNRLWLEIKLH